MTYSIVFPSCVIGCHSPWVKLGLNSVWSVPGSWGDDQCTVIEFVVNLVSFAVIALFAKKRVHFYSLFIVFPLFCIDIQRCVMYGSKWYYVLIGYVMSYVCSWSCDFRLRLSMKIRLKKIGVMEIWGNSSVWFRKRGCKRGRGSFSKILIKLIYQVYKR